MSFGLFLKSRAFALGFFLSFSLVMESLKNKLCLRIPDGVIMRVFSGHLICLRAFIVGLFFLSCDVFCINFKHISMNDKTFLVTHDNQIFYGATNDVDFQLYPPTKNIVAHNIMRIGNLAAFLILDMEDHGWFHHLYPEGDTPTVPRKLEIKNIVGINVIADTYLAYDGEGKLWAFSYQSDPKEIPLELPIAFMSGNFALDKRGKVWTWNGNREHGQIIPSPTEVLNNLPPIKQIAIGASCQYFLDEQNIVWVNKNGQPDQFYSLKAQQIAAGQWVFAALSMENELIIWGLVKTITNQTKGIDSPYVSPNIKGKMVEIFEENILILTDTHKLIEYRHAEEVIERNSALVLGPETSQVKRAMNHSIILQ